MQKLLRPAEAARELGVHRQSICRAMDCGRLKFVVVAGYRADLQESRESRPQKRNKS